MKPKEYRVEKFDRSIHMEPKVHPTDEQMKADANLPVKISKKAEVYVWPNGKIDIMFKDQNKTQPPTLTVVAKFPFLTLMQSSSRFNAYFSFSKQEVKLLEREILFSREYWLEAMYAAIESQKLGESEEELQERIAEIKKKGDFV